MNTLSVFIITWAIFIALHVCALENMARGKSVWEDRPWGGRDNWRGGKAVDGRYTDRSARGGQCTISYNYARTATWGVDLGGVVSISHINIYYRTDNKNPSPYIKRMAGFFLYVSNTTSKEDGHLCFHKIQTVNGTPSVDQSIKCSVHGRSVIYYNERLPNVTYPSYYSTYAFYELCELEVYGCSNTGYYGPDCTIPCPTNCQEKRCDVNTGYCLGCVPGYQGPTCDTYCKQFFFGDGCSRQCGSCKNRQTCHHINGSCPNGCDEGVTGWNCTTACQPGFYGKDCTTNCSVNCNVTSSCDRLYGECKGGCKPGWTGITCTEIAGESEGTATAGIVGGIFAVVILILVAVVGIILYKRVRRERSGLGKDRYITATSSNPHSNTIYQNIGKMDEDGDKLVKDDQQKPYAGKHHEKDVKDDEIDTDEKIHEENPYGDFYINENTIPEIDPKNLGKIIECKSKNEDDEFKKEYATLLYGERHPCEIGKLPENIPKNRFKTTFPYDHSRVILTDSLSDYINANYIDGLQKGRRYIASQGPKQNTLADHWRMIWQENVLQIVMVTNLKEGLKDKCVQYWPDINDNMTCGSFELTTIEEKIYAYYAIRKIRITHKKHNVSRTTLHYQYTAWPDHGTPDPMCLLLFHNHVTRTKPNGHNGPTLVHCSAGIGRTGTYIAIDALSKTLTKNRKINIAELVKKMRENRMNMVQTYEQYKTIFMTLHEMVRAPIHVQNATEFLTKLDAKSQDKPAKASSLKAEFQKLQSLRPRYTDNDYKMALQNGDVSSPVRPVDRYVLFLTSSVPRRGNYINAIYLPSIMSQKAFIITSHPTPDNTVDLLRLLVDHESKVLVTMEPLTNIETVNHWFPNSNKPKVVPPFKTRLLQDNSSDIRNSKVEIVQEACNEAWSVEIAQPLSDRTKDHPQKISMILGLVTFAKNFETDAPITVVSRDGAALCGVFCAVYNAVQQLTLDDEVDVFSVVRQLQIRRPELCSTRQEYTLIHDCLRRFIHSRDLQTGENIYSNQ